MLLLQAIAANNDNQLIFIAPIIKPNMKKILLACVAVLVFACSGDDNSQSNDERCIYKGNVTLKTQEEVDAFVSHGFCTVDGNLTIGDYYEDPKSNINSLQGLSGITTVTGNVTVVSNSLLESLNGLQNIKDVSKISVVSNHRLQDLKGFPSLDNDAIVEIANNLGMATLEGLNVEKCKSIALYSNISLKNILALQNLQEIKSLRMQGNGMINLEGLEAITQIEELMIDTNPNLVSLKGLDNLKRSDYFSIRSNHALVTLEHLSNFVAIGDIESDMKIHYFSIAENNNLESLHGLENLAYFLGNVFEINYNPKLHDFCALTNFFQLNTLSHPDISDNAYNPTQSQISAGNCSQP